MGQFNGGVGAKVAHVKAAANPGGHHCHWPGCSASVKPAMWGCKKHWYMLPGWIRTMIWRTYQPGQEASKQPSLEYVKAAKKAQDWIVEHHPPKVPPQGAFPL